MHKPAVLSVSNVFFSYSDTPVLKNINFELLRGEFTGIIGPNGAGKSTLIRLAAALLENYRGSIQIAGQDIKDLNRRKLALKTSYVPQNIDPNFPFSVKEIIRMGRYPHQNGLFAEDNNANEAVRLAIENMDLSILQNRPFSALSGGEKQRAVIASALAQDSDLLLLDEPTTALDLRHQQLILSKLKQLTTAGAKTTLLVTHDINLAAQFCDRIILMDHGEILADGTPKEVLNFELIQQVYGVKVYIDVNPFTDSIYILPYKHESL